MTEPRHAWDEEFKAALKEAPTSPAKALLPGPVYEALKWGTLIALPAISTLYGTLAPVWGWAFSGEVALTTTAICTFLGVVLGITTAHYDKNDVGVSGTLDLGAKAQLALNEHPQAGDKVTLRVQ